MAWECLFQGNLLPQFEEHWPIILRLLLYLFLLGYCFLGIAIISDIFMSGIEKVTSWKKRVKNPETGRIITVYVWNSTVANLTLMALGSSAPEILLSVIEITTNNMQLGDLGAGTIVGSAAFNLLVISAVCVLAMEDGEVRYINQVPVYMITSSFSVAAYLWLMFILMVTSPDVCEVWEGMLTLAFCPILVILAYLADRGYFSCLDSSKNAAEEKKPLQALPDDVTKEQLAQIEQEIREQHGLNLTAAQVATFMEAQYCTRRNKAFYSHIGMQQALKGKKPPEGAPAAPPDLAVSAATNTQDVAVEENTVTIEFATSKYAYMENCGNALVTLVRNGPAHMKASVKFKTRAGTATAGLDYEETEGTLVFGKGETQKTLAILIHNDNAYENAEEFYVDLTMPMCEDVPHTPAKLGEISSVTVVIIDDDDPGQLRFKVEELEFEEGREEKTLEVEVERINGGSGTVSCKYHTENMGAVAGVDYEAASGRIEFEPSIQSITIPIKISATGRYVAKAAFNLVLSDPVLASFDKETDGGAEACICHIVIKGVSGEGRDRVLNKMATKLNASKVANMLYKQQFIDALFAVGGDDDEDGDDGMSSTSSMAMRADPDPGEDVEKKGPSKMDYFIHFMSVPWKLLFAFVPPPDYCGGWLCFCGSLVMIAVVTAIVGDVANLVGCCLNIEAEITAITFVALGTSLPDTFASKAAAVMDPYADNSIGNITGSNSVNVFIGLGLSWGLAALYWEAQPPTDLWVTHFLSLTPGQQTNVLDVMGCADLDACRTADGGWTTNSVFIVPAGSLWFNLMVFSFNAFFAIQHLFARRRKFGGELGGPKKGFFGQYFSAVFLVSQWFIYIIASSIFVTVRNS